MWGPGFVTPDPGPGERGEQRTGLRARVSSSPPSVTYLKAWWHLLPGRNRHINTGWGRRAELFGAGDGLRNRHCSPWISVRFLSLLAFSCALILHCSRLLAAFEHKATETRPRFR